MNSAKHSIQSLSIGVLRQRISPLGKSRDICTIYELPMRSHATRIPIDIVQFDPTDWETAAVARDNDEGIL